MKKRALALLLAASTLSVLFTGCSSQTTADTPSAGGADQAVTENSAEPSEPSAEPVEVKTIYASTKGYPSPYMIVDENNELSGYDIEVLQKVFERLPQYELEFVLAEGDAVLTGLTSGLYDVAVNNFAYREERAESYYYSYPYNKFVYYFIQRPGDEPLTSFQDVADRGYRYEASAGTNYTTAIERWNEEHPDSQIEMEYSGTELAVAFEHVVDGLFDFRIHDAPTYNQYQEEFNFDLVAYPMSEEASKAVSSSDCSYFLFPKTEEGDALRNEVNAVLKELSDEGILKELGEKYFGVDQTPTEEDFANVIN